MASNVSVNGQLNNTDLFASVTNNSSISGNRFLDEFTLLPAVNAAGQPLTLAVTATNSSGVFDTYLEVLNGNTLVADADDNGTNTNSLIAPGQLADGPGADNDTVPNSLTIVPGVTYGVRVLSFSDNPTLPATYTINASVPSGDLTLIPRNITVSVNSPVADSLGAGDPSGVTNINQVSGEFYNLSDASDVTNLDPALTNGKIVRGLGNSDRIQGTSGSDSINGNVGADTVFGGNGSDDLRGGKGSDSLIGEDGDDSLFGNNNNDSLEGRDGNDLIRGGRESDLLLGGSGNDTLVGDLDRDILTGGSDNDIFVLRGLDAAAATIEQADLITDFTTGDLIGLADGISFSQLLLNPVFITFGSSTAAPSTAIYNVAAGNYLGIVLGVIPTALTQTSFISVNLT